MILVVSFELWFLVSNWTMLQVALLALSVTLAEKCHDYKAKCHKVKEGVVNVHLIAHSHDDTGYRKTVDQYYYG